MILDGNSTRGVMMLRSLNVETFQNSLPIWRQCSKDAASLKCDFLHFFVDILDITSCRVTVGLFDDLMQPVFGSATALQTTL